MFNFCGSGTFLSPSILISSSFLRFVDLILKQRHKHKHILMCFSLKPFLTFTLSLSNLSHDSCDRSNKLSPICLPSYSRLLFMSDFTSSVTSRWHLAAAFLSVKLPFKQNQLHPIRSTLKRMRVIWIIVFTSYHRVYKHHAQHTENNDVISLRLRTHLISFTFV